jgi:uncharacterized protein YbjT (DUF2867 family)
MTVTLDLVILEGDHNSFLNLGEDKVQGHVISVLGGTGFVGRHVVRRLAKAGALIRVGCRHPNEGLFLKTMGEVGQIQLNFTNIRDDESVRQLVSGSQAVINLVGILHEGGKQKFQAIHSEGAARVARISSEQGVEHLVQMSALGADPASDSLYAKSKAAGEQEVRSAFPNAAIVRPSLIFGAEDHFFNRFAQLAKISPFIPLIGGGKTRFQPVYVGDVADAIVRLTLSSHLGQLFELAGGKVYTFRQLMELLLATMGIDRVLLPIPAPVGYAGACLTEWLPSPPLTRDQLKLLQCDNVASGRLPGLKELGIVPASLEAILPTYIHSSQQVQAA